MRNVLFWALKRVLSCPPSLGFVMKVVFEVVFDEIGFSKLAAAARRKQRPFIIGLQQQSFPSQLAQPSSKEQTFMPCVAARHTVRCHLQTKIAHPRPLTQCSHHERQVAWLVAFCSSCSASVGFAGTGGTLGAITSSHHHQKARPVLSVLRVHLPKAPRCTLA